MLRHHSTYEIMRPEDVGLSRTNLVLGKHSGRHAFRERVKDLGYELTDGELNTLFDEFKALADKKKELFDGDIEALILRAESGAEGPWQLAGLKVATESNSPAQAQVKLRHADGRNIEQGSPGDGPVDATIKAIEIATGVKPELCKFDVHSASLGEDAQGEAVLTVQYNGRSYRGTGVSLDIVEAAALAFLEVINRIEGTRANVERIRA
jgi:2-isopropylmalate synthase